jgi:hypothetical protein
MSRAQRIAIEVLVVLAATGLISVLLTWPLATDIGSLLPGNGQSSDVTGYFWDVWNNHTNGMDLWGGSLQESLGYPFGRPGVGGANLTLLVFTGPTWLLANVMSVAAAINVVTLAGIALSGAAMYLLVRWLGLGRGPAAWAAVAYELSPYMFLRVGAHPPLAHIEFAPLLLMAAIYWVRRPGWRAALLLALAVLFAWLSNPYYGTMALISAGVAIVVGVVLMARQQNWRTVLTRVGEAIAFLVALVIGPLLVLFVANGQSSDVIRRTSRELSDYGARLWDYVVPPPGSQLIYGITGKDAFSTTFSPGGERTAFLGWLVIALAITGLVMAWRRRRTLGATTRLAVLVTLPVMLVMGLLSMASPTRILGIDIPMPSALVYQVLPFLRVYARFGVMVLACALVLAAIALRLITKNRGPLFHHSVIAAAIIITAVEMPLGFGIATGPVLTIDGRDAAATPTWQWLRAHPDGTAVIEAPAFTNEDLDREYMYGQTVHGHPIANGGLNENTAPADFDEAYGNPLFPRAAGAYATAGIRRVAIEPWAYRRRGLTAPDAAKPPAGYAVEATFPDGSAIWKVTASPGVAVAFPVRSTWGLPYSSAGQRWRYALPSATMRVYAPAARRTEVAIPARGRHPGVAYAASITDPDGTIHHFTIKGTTVLRFTSTLPAGLSEFHVTTPADAADADGTVAMAEWTFSPR